MYVSGCYSGAFSQWQPEPCDLGTCFVLPVVTAESRARWAEADHVTQLLLFGFKHWHTQAAVCACV